MAEIFILSGRHAAVSVRRRDYYYLPKGSLMRFRLHGDEAGTVHEGMLQADGTFPRADHNAGTAVIALAGIHDDGVLPFHR